MVHQQLSLLEFYFINIQSVGFILGLFTYTVDKWYFSVLTSQNYGLCMNLHKINRTQCLSGYILISSSFEEGNFVTCVNVRLRFHREVLLTELPGSFHCVKTFLSLQIIAYKISTSDGWYSMHCKR